MVSNRRKIFLCFFQVTKYKTWPGLGILWSPRGLVDTWRDLAVCVGIMCILESDTVKTQEADSPASRPPRFLSSQAWSLHGHAIYLHFMVSLTLLLPLFCTIYLTVKCRFSSGQPGSWIDSFYKQENTHRAHHKCLNMAICLSALLFPLSLHLLIVSPWLFLLPSVCLILCMRPSPSVLSLLCNLHGPPSF